MAGNTNEAELDDARSRFFAKMILDGPQGVRPVSPELIAANQELAKAMSLFIATNPSDQHQNPPEPKL